MIFLLREECLSFCVHRYSVRVSHVFNNTSSGSLRVDVKKSHDGSAAASAGLLAEAFELRDGILELPHSQLSLARDDDANDIINFVCSA
jgi:hypothetical protein